MNYVIRKRCAQKITSFYRNVSKKYKHTYSLELMEKNVNEAYDSMFQIENTLMRRQPNIIRWKGLLHGQHRQMVFRLYLRRQNRYRCGCLPCPKHA